MRPLTQARVADHVVRTRPFRSHFGSSAQFDQLIDCETVGDGSVGLCSVDVLCKPFCQRHFCKWLCLGHSSPSGGVHPTVRRTTVMHGGRMLRTAELMNSGETILGCATFAEHEPRNSSKNDVLVVFGKRGAHRDSHCAKGDGGLDGRVQFFKPLFDRAEVDVVAVQESREQGDPPRPGLLRVPTQWGAPELNSGFDDREVLCWIISKPSLRSWLLRGSGFMTWLCLSSQHMRHTKVARLRPKAPFRSLCAQTLHLPRLLVTGLPFSATSMPDWALWVPVLGIHDKEVENKDGAMFRHTLVGCNLVAYSQFFPLDLDGRRATASSIAPTTLVSLTNCTMQCLSPTLSRTKCSLRGN